ncbi:MAG TPA: ATP-binding cassette domain-containing protein [Verrucomicrobiae bacterium]|nr:ATP-binding cassette domain-containing protein [Verrucomicrobiae bacterium]
MTTALSITNVGVRLGGRDILQKVDAEIAPGEFVGVFGPNGAGKSTLMRCILGLTPLCSGSISVFGEPPGQANKVIGYLPQSRASLEGTALTARSLVSAAEGGNGWGMPWITKSAHEEVERAIELAGVGDCADRPFSVLSGGEKQRVALAQALLGKPRLLILDEPLASLDPRNQMRMVECIAQIKATTGAAILFIAHDINPLLGVMDRVIYMAGGGAAIGAADDIISSAALSKLYGTEINVVRAEGKVFIVAAEGNVTEAAHHD